MTIYNKRLDRVLSDYADEHRNHAYKFDDKEMSAYEYFEDISTDLYNYSRLAVEYQPVVQWLCELSGKSGYCKSVIVCKYCIRHASYSSL